MKLTRAELHLIAIALHYLIIQEPDTSHPVRKMAIALLDRLDPEAEFITRGY